MLMRSGSSCSKGTLSSARIISLLAVSFLLICMTACGAAPDSEKSTVQETGTETEAAVVTSEMTESNPEPVSTMDKVGETTAQVPVSTDTAPAAGPQDGENETKDAPMKNLKMEINGTEVAVSWEDNESVAALMELAGEEPVTVQMTMYGGFEQVGPLGTSLPRNDRQTTTSAGDIVLYSGNQIVVFYGSNAWSYTRLGHVNLTAAETSELLSHGDVNITIHAE